MIFYWLSSGRRERGKNVDMERSGGWLVVDRLNTLRVRMMILIYIKRQHTRRHVSAERSSAEKKKPMNKQSWRNEARKNHIRCIILWRVSFLPNSEERWRECVAWNLCFFWVEVKLSLEEIDCCCWARMSIMWHRAALRRISKFVKLLRQQSAA